MKQSINKEYYIEKQSSFFSKKKTARPLREGLDQMLNVQQGRKTLVEINNMDVYYGSGKKKFRAINDFSIKIFEGEVLGLVGESGSGKTTVGMALAGLISHQFGQIKIAGETLPHKNSKIKKKLNEFLANKVQMIFQDPANSLNPNKNIFDIISEGLDNLSRKNKGYLLESTLFNFDQDFVSLIFEKYFSTFFKNSEEKEERFNFISEKLSIPDLEIIYEIYDKWPKKYSNKELIEDIEKAKKKRQEISKQSLKDLKYNLIVKILKDVGLDEVVLRRYPLEFSGGQQQRIGISRAVVLRPKLLIADEPISALDVSIQAQVVNIFNDLKKQYKLTILFIAHDLRMVEYISDRIAVMYQGVLLEIGPAKEIMNNSIHPYTKSLLEAVPSIESKVGSLIGYVYDPKKHQYTKENQPKWIDLGNDHFVLATDQELNNWKKNIY